MRSIAFLCTGILLILLEANLYRALGLAAPNPGAQGISRLALSVLSATPDLVLPLIVFLGVQEQSIVRGAFMSFLLGHALDLFASAPIGLLTFVSVALFCLARVAGVRLTAQTALTRIPLVFVFSMVQSGIILTLLAIFGSDTRRPLEILQLVLPRALLTALCSPVVFKIAQRLYHGAAWARPDTAGTA
jgi:rod shape-determining protein MreD